MNDTDQFPECQHERTEVRKRMQVNGVTAGHQCLKCGKKVKHVYIRDVNLNMLPLWNTVLEEAYRKQVNEFYRKRQEAYERGQAQQQIEWRRFYEQHLLSDKWKQLRRKVFARCNGVCEGCGERQAVQVHHLNYKRLGNEMLFDLAAVCMTCHEICHPREGDTENP